MTDHDTTPDTTPGALAPVVHIAATTETAQRMLDIADRLQRAEAGGTLPWHLASRDGYGYDIEGANDDLRYVTEGDDGGGAFYGKAEAALCAHAPADLRFLLNLVSELLSREP